ncbi:VOC family protein [Micromonospora sp. NPDC047738]|uniref:VOC family protein n=1 Tax=unclassified Micromonospora TaxID=2617518 RepID=UPI0033C42E5E
MTEPPGARELFPILVTADLPAALRFYRDLLGGVETYRYPASGEVEFVALQVGASSLGLGVPDGSEELTNNRVRLWAYVPDCDAAHDRLRDAGVTVLAAPVDQPWGERMAVVLDPDGNQVMLADRR